MRSDAVDSSILFDDGVLHPRFSTRSNSSVLDLFCGHAGHSALNKYFSFLYVGLYLLNSPLAPVVSWCLKEAPEVTFTIPLTEIQSIQANCPCNLLFILDVISLTHEGSLYIRILHRFVRHDMDETTITADEIITGGSANCFLCDLILLCLRAI